MKIRRRHIILLALIILVVLVPLSLEYATAKPGFCGSCHIMNKYYATWKDSRHDETDCVECHYAPGEQHTLTAKFRGLSQLFSYLGSADSSVRKRTKINDLSCTTAKCHDPSDERFALKKVSFTKTVSYVHKTHFDKTIEGQELHCATCHQNVSAKTHFEVPESACYLCHFKNTKFNEGRGKCLLCHEITYEPLQKQFENSSAGSDKPISHKSLQDAGVPCSSCHIQLVKGNGEIKKEDCLNCHEVGEELEKADDRKLMHEKHVAGQEAKCTNCHQPIIHKEVEDYLETVRAECSLCHPDHHQYQKALLSGTAIEGVSETPSLMLGVKTNCLACHTQEGKDINGESILRGSEESCSLCHTERHKAMVQEWIVSIKNELGMAKEMEEKAAAAVMSVKGKMPDSDFDELAKMLKMGKRYLNIIDAGHGVHNKKYSIMLIDEALGNFEDILEELNEK